MRQQTQNSRQNWGGWVGPALYAISIQKEILIILDDSLGSGHYLHHPGGREKTREGHEHFTFWMGRVMNILNFQQGGSWTFCLMGRVMNFFPRGEGRELHFLRPLTNVSGLYSVAGLAVSVVHASCLPWTLWSDRSVLSISNDFTHFQLEYLHQTFRIY